MNKNIRYVNYKDEDERSLLVEHYEMYGYYVKVENGRIVVNSKWPKKPAKKNDRKSNNRRVDRPER